MYIFILLIIIFLNIFYKPNFFLKIRIVLSFILCTFLLILTVNLLIHVEPLSSSNKIGNFNSQAVILK